MAETRPVTPGARKERATDAGAPGSGPVEHATVVNPGSSAVGDAGRVVPVTHSAAPGSKPESATPSDDTARKAVSGPLVGGAPPDGPRELTTILHAASRRYVVLDLSTERGLPCGSRG
jgi:hypothetical protein